MNLVLLVAVGVLMQAVRSFDVLGSGGASGPLLGFGYVLVSAFFAGALFKELRLPRLTGYIVVGVVSGPTLLGLLSPEMVGSLDTLGGIAVSTIALSAGTELDLRAMRPLLRTVRAITLWGVLGTTALLAMTVLLLRPWLPFLRASDPVQGVAVALVLGVVMVAQSPAVVVALRDEMRADGPVARTVLGVVVLADLVVIVLFALCSTLAKSALGTSGDVAGMAALLAWRIAGSFVVGALVGVGLAAYLRKVARDASLFLLFAIVLVAEAGRRLQLDPLLIALAAGVLVRNATSVAPVLTRELQPSALPVSIVFFATAGATLHLEALRTVWFPAGVLVAVRAGGLFLGSRWGARRAGAPPSVVRFAGVGLLPQAGLALALATLFVKTFPEFGSAASALTLGVVALNELLAPALFRGALVRAGEVGRLAAPEPSVSYALPGSSPPPS